MENEKKNRGIGLGLILAGAMLVLVNYLLMTYENKYAPKLLMAGIVVLVLGFGYTLFPGAAVDTSNKKEFWKLKMKATPLPIKLIWLLFLIGGVVLTFVVFDYYHLSLI